MKIWFILLLILSMTVSGRTPAWSLVTSEQVVVVANRNQPESMELGTYYLARRGIPSDHLIALDLPMTESISREVYNQNLRNPLSAEMRQRGLDDKTRSLVTLWGVPLVVKGVGQTAVEEGWIQDAQDWSVSAIGFLQEQEQSLRGWLYAEGHNSTRSSPLGAASPESDSLLQQGKLSDWKKYMTQIFQEKSQRLETMTDPEQQQAASQMLSKFQHRIFGRYGGTGSAGVRDGSTPPDQPREEVAVRNLLVSLLHEPTSAKRGKAYEIVQEAFGLLGIVAMANWEIKRYRHEESHASVDSELAMLWWDSDTYPLAGRIPNPWYMGSPVRPQDWPFPVLMVSRLDAPTVAIARHMIDQAIATEVKGLTGNIYVDARGLKGGRLLSYGHYDSNMQEFAAEMSGLTDMKVILENTEQRFSQPGQAPNVSVYVGWYRLRNYEDAFTFQPGAIGYHIASGEAVSLHDPNEPGWCKNALERGVTVTLGPVSEP